MNRGTVVDPDGYQDDGSKTNEACQRVLMGAAACSVQMGSGRGGQICFEAKAALWIGAVGVCGGSVEGWAFMIAVESVTCPAHQQEEPDNTPE